jgi:RNA polymerase sigma-70 factor (ECF subfamily)
LSPAELAEQEVTALYWERANEFLAYAIRFGRDEDLAKDALQEAFLRYFVSLCEGQRIESPRAWIYRVMHNYLLDRKKQSCARNECGLSRTLAYAPEIENACLRQELEHLVRETLSRREYECFRLRTEGMRYREIAARTHLSSGTVGTLISRALRKIKRILDPEEMKFKPMVPR